MSRIKKIAYLTGARADFGLMEYVLQSIDKNPDFILQIYVTGIHLMKEYGFTANLVKKRFPNSIILKSRFRDDKQKSIISFLSSLTFELGNIFENNPPDFVLVQGDRPEMLALAEVCTYMGIPFGHTHGGDKTLTVDESVRHAITKLANIHFAATHEAAKRIEKMGEEKWRIKIIGAPALDYIKNTPVPSKQILFQHLHLPILESAKYILLTEHAVSSEINDTKYQINQIIKAVKKIKLPVVAIYPNADPGSKEIISALKKEKNKKNFFLFKNIDYNYFLSLEKHAAVWIGNSSAAMIESSSFRVPVVDIGTRQKGRLHGANVIHANYSETEIIAAIKKSLNDKYISKIKKSKNPWGGGKAAEKIVKIIENLTIDKKLLVKQITY